MKIRVSWVYVRALQGQDAAALQRYVGAMDHSPRVRDEVARAKRLTGIDEVAAKHVMRLGAVLMKVSRYARTRRDVDDGGDKALVDVGIHQSCSQRELC